MGIVCLLVTLHTSVSPMFSLFYVKYLFSNLTRLNVQSCPKLASIPCFNYKQGSRTGTGRPMSSFAECLTFLRIPYVPSLRSLRYSKETLLPFLPPPPIPLFMPALFQGTLNFSFLHGVHAKQRGFPGNVS